VFGEFDHDLPVYNSFRQATLSVMKGYTKGSENFVMWAILPFATPSPFLLDSLLTQRSYEMLVAVPRKEKKMKSS
jgi:hypothetical protein